MNLRGFTLYLELHSRQLQLRTWGLNSSKVHSLSVHLGQSPSMPFHPSQLFASGSQGSGQATLLPNAFNTTTLQEPASGNWNMDTSASSHLNDSVHYLSVILNMCIYPSVAVGDWRFIPVTNFGRSVLSSPSRPPTSFQCDHGGEFDNHVFHKLFNDNDTNHKLGPRATPSIFLGHAANHFGYRCLDLNTNKIIISRHVTFDETVFPFPSTKSTTTPSYDFLDDSTDLISTIIRTAPITPVPAPVHTPLVDVPTPPTPPTPPPPPTPQSVPQIVPEHAPAPTNDPPTVSIHPMVTRSRVGTTRPNPRYAGHLFLLDIVPVHQLDSQEAVFTWGLRLRLVYMHQPPGFRDPEHPDYVCLLQRSLYGLKQAPRAWFQRFAAYITTVGFTLSLVTPLYYLPDWVITTFLLLYVDDIVLTASSDRLLHQIIASLHREFSMTDLDALNYFLGISVTRDSSGMFLS
ncbi:ribonuclease H-like domain-containing protein [Tanacetum coccineum]